MERYGTLAFAETQPAAAAVAASRHIVYSVWNAAVPPSMKRAANVDGSGCRRSIVRLAGERIV